MRYHFRNKLKAKIKHYKESYAKVQELLESLQKEKESWVNKLGATKIKSRELDALKETLKSSLEDVIRSKKELEGEESELRDEVVTTSDTYFGCAKEQLSFL